MKQNETVTNSEYEKDYNQMSNDIKKFLTETYDPELFVKMNEYFLQFIMNSFDLDQIYCIFFNQSDNVNDIEIEHYYDIFRKTIHYYDMNVLNQKK